MMLACTLLQHHMGRNHLHTYTPAALLASLVTEVSKMVTMHMHCMCATQTPQTHCGACSGDSISHLDPKPLAAYVLAHCLARLLGFPKAVVRLRWPFKCCQHSVSFCCQGGWQHTESWTSWCCPHGVCWAKQAAFYNPYTLRLGIQ